MAYQNFNPSSRNVLKRFEEISDMQLEATLEAAGIRHEQAEKCTCLAMSKISKRSDKTQAIANCETGAMFINNIDRAGAELPFGGINDCGYGRDLGNAGVQEFANLNLLHMTSMAAPT
jgi:acyl-CoA reductase-like NAD-dependent aldehyde dehydrogenase